VQFTKSIALDKDNKPRLFLIKNIKESELDKWVDDGNTVDSVIDKWIYITPSSPHIVRAFEVFRDDNKMCYQLIEYWPNACSVLMKLKAMKLNLSYGAIPQELCALIFLYIAQVANAMSIAHASGLTHGKLNLGQVLYIKLNEKHFEFKVTSFRPWLVRNRDKNNLLNYDEML
jgi:hypothetical protein